jgi:hypothetical protein
MDSANEARFWSKVDANGVCWEWTGAVMSKGYGTISIGGRCKRAHRVAYELLVGPIPARLVLDHLCRVRRCVNPDHMQAVTHRENTFRSPITAAVRNAAKTHCIRGHPFDGTNTIVRADGWRRCRQCFRDRDRLYYAKRQASRQP